MPSFQSPYRLAPKITAAAWCALAIFLLWAGNLPNEYLIYIRHVTAKQPYPFLATAVELVSSGIIFAAMAWAFLDQAWQRVAKLAAVFVLAVIVGVFSAPASAHTAPHFAYFALAMILTAVFALLAALALAILGLIARQR
jgi:hypothetical protein